MEQLHFCLGLPRSGSTLLMNILQQNPSIFSSSSSPTPYFIGSGRSLVSSVSEFLAMDQDQLDNALHGFYKQGLKGWYESLTDKPVVISKSRVWDQELNTLFRLYKNPKIIVNVRDLRDIVCSFEKLMFKYPMWEMTGPDDSQLHHLPRHKRIEAHCVSSFSNLGRPLSMFPHIMEWVRKRPECFFILRIEDFSSDPYGGLKALYEWLDLPYFNHDLNNIPQAQQYEHDTVYRALVTHKTDLKLRALERTHETMLTEQESKLIVTNNAWFYNTFYPEIYKQYVSNS